MRRHYIDNLRNFTIMLLFPVHTFMIWNDFGSKFYIWQDESRIYFYTHFTDLSGYDGAFTPGHLWFILFLFLISMISLLLFHHFPHKKSFIMVEKILSWQVLSLFIPIWLMYYLGNFGGFSIGKNYFMY